MPQETSISFETDRLDSFVSEAVLAAHWHVSCRTLQRWRKRGTGPRFSVIGSLIRYRIRDILAFESGEQSRKGSDK